MQKEIERKYNCFVSKMFLEKYFIKVILFVIFTISIMFIINILFL